MGVVHCTSYKEAQSITEGIRGVVSTFSGVEKSSSRIVISHELSDVNEISEPSGRFSEK